MDSLEIGSIGSRLDRLPATARVWQLVALISLGGFFENYDLFFTGYIAPGLFRDHIITPTTLSFFGQGLAAFIASLFAGLFIGTIVFGFVADKFGRRTVFTCALLWYSVASVIMAFQTDATGLYFWRFVAGVGIGVELVTIDTYISELVPKSIRGRAFAFYQAIQFSVVPIVAFLSYKLVPIEAYGFSGWRWVVGDRIRWRCRGLVYSSGRSPKARAGLLPMVAWWKPTGSRQNWRCGWLPSMERPCQPSAWRNKWCRAAARLKYCGRPTLGAPLCSQSLMPFKLLVSTDLPIGCRHCLSSRASPSPQACSTRSSLPLRRHSVR